MCANHPVVHRQLNCTFSKVTEPATMGLDQAEEDTRSSLAAINVPQLPHGLCCEP